MKNKLYEILGMLLMVSVIVGVWGGISMLLEFLLVILISALVIGLVVIALPQIFIGE